jgi:hypothetical protein
MGFPFITQAFDDKVKEELKVRSEKKLTGLNRFTPFIWISSGAMVCKGPLKDQIDSNVQSAQYKGCVLTNHIDPKLKYPLKETVLGYDLDGKLITVEGESGLKVSTPIIESMEIDTDGENNTLKIARINVTIFSLKQLEMFELFFLKPQMTVVMEYGHNNPDSQIKNSIAKESFLVGKNWKTYVDECIEYFYPNAETYKDTRKKYFEKLKNTKFNYDFWIGRVTNFNITYESADNVYKVTLEISSGNELHLWMPYKQNAARKDAQNPSSTATNTPAPKPGAETWMSELCGKLILSEKSTQDFISKAEKEYAKEFFNWGVTSQTTTTEAASKESYVSFKLILNMMNSMNIIKYGEDSVVDLKVFKDGKDYCIPVTSHPSIISTNSNFIIPGTLPTIVVNKKRSIDLDIKTKLNYKINEKSFNYDTIPTITNEKSGTKPKLDGFAFGNLFNIFVKTSYFVSLFKSTYTYADFFTAILGDINKLLFGTCKLEIVQPESDLKSGLTIIDKKIPQQKIVTNDRSIYRFKLGPTESIVHDITFNLEMSNLMQAQALYESQLIILKAKENELQDPAKTQEKTAGNTFVSGKETFKYINQPNLDNLTSIDWVNYKILDAKTPKYNKTPTTDGAVNDESEDSESEAKKKLDSVISTKSIKFKSQTTGGAPVTLIYNDSTFVQAFISTQKKNTSVLTYLECDVTIDGISGLRCGELFHIDGVPETYNKNGAFQILNIKQSVQDDTGWRTTINAGFRYNVE